MNSKDENMIVFDGKNAVWFILIFILYNALPLLCFFL